MTPRDLAAGLGESAQERAIARDVEAELAAHLVLAAEALEAEGHDPGEARTLARERFGDLERIRRDCLRIRLGGSHAMKIALLVSNLVLVAALLVSLLVARAQHVRAQEAMEQALIARAMALEAAERARGAAPAPLQDLVVEVGDSIEIVDTYHQEDFPERVEVQPDGQALFPAAGWLRVAGLTRAELEQRLREAYAPLYEQLELHAVVHKTTPEAPLSGAPSLPSGGPGVAGTHGQLVSGDTVIEAGDTIEILDRNGRFDLGGPRRVDADGRVLLPRLGWTPVAGLGRDKLAEQLTVSYQPYFGQLPVDVLLHKPGAAAGTAATPSSESLEEVPGGATTVIEVGDSVEVLDRHRRIEFDGRIRVEADGKLLLPHLGWTPVVGLERDELASRLTEAYADYYTDLVIDVIVHKRTRGPITTLESKSFSDF